MSGCQDVCVVMDYESSTGDFSRAEMRQARQVLANGRTRVRFEAALTGNPHGGHAGERLDPRRRA